MNEPRWQVGQGNPQPPPVITPNPPPVLPQPPRKEGVSDRIKKKAPWLVPIVAFLAKAKSLLLGLKFLPLGKVLLTGGSMLASIALYSLAFGWPFAVGFVLCIFIHEMGHVFVAWRQGLPISAPVFVPFMGAVIFNKRSSKSAWDQAVMGIGGPIGGTIAGLVCWALFYATQNPFFLALAYVTFFINLFNLTPVMPLDGGWITGAVSPYLWIAGLLFLIFEFVTGHLTNPMIIVLVALSIRGVWQGLRTGRTGYGNVMPATPSQRWIMGACYVALGGFLFWSMKATGIEEMMARPPRSRQVAVRAVPSLVNDGPRTPPEISPILRIERS